MSLKEQSIVIKGFKLLILSYLIHSISQFTKKKTMQRTKRFCYSLNPTHFISRLVKKVSKNGARIEEQLQCLYE